MPLEFQLRWARCLFNLDISCPKSSDDLLRNHTEYDFIALHGASAFSNQYNFAIGYPGLQQNIEFIAKLGRSAFTVQPQEVTGRTAGSIAYPGFDGLQIKVVVDIKWPESADVNSPDAAGLAVLQRFLDFGVEESRLGPNARSGGNRQMEKET